MEKSILTNILNTPQPLALQRFAGFLGKFGKKCPLWKFHKDLEKALQIQDFYYGGGARIRTQTNRQPLRSAGVPINAIIYHFIFYATSPRHR